MQAAQLGNTRTIKDDRSGALNMYPKKAFVSLLPFTIRGRGGVQLVIEELTENHIPAIYEIIRCVIDGGKSALSSTEFATEETFRKFLSSSSAVFSIKESSSRSNIIGFLNVLPQGLCRSAFPIISRGYSIIHPSFSGKGFFADLIRFLSACSIAAGYLGNLAHVPQKYGNSVLPAKEIGFFTTLLVPNGVHLLQTGWWDDCLMYVDFVRGFPHLPNTKLSEDDIISRAVGRTWIKDHDITPFKLPMEASVRPHNFTTARVRKVMEEGEAQKIYDLLCSAAKSADDFGVDEFPSFTIFCNKYLAGRGLHAIEDVRTSTVMGAVIVGRSHLTRGNPNFAMMYIYLLPSYRRRGYGTLIEKSIADHLKTHGYVGMLTDMLMTDINVYKFASGAGYVNIGSVPRSAYVTKQGWTDAAVLYKKFDEPMKKSWLNDFSKRIRLKASL